MADFEFLENPLIKKWVILAPRRAKRPDVAKGFEPVCPFCLGREKDEPEVYRVPSVILGSGATPESDAGQASMTSSDWQVRVVNNKFPFAPIHEVIIHSPDHHKNFDELPLSQVELIIQTYRQRYLTHQKKGQVYIFHNRGEAAGESLPHPHTQLAVVPFEVKMDIPRLDPSASATIGPESSVILNSLNSHPELDSGSRLRIKSAMTNSQVRNDTKQTSVQTSNFYLFCPKTSQWPDEVWVAPKKRGRAFGEITDEEIADLATTIARLIQIFDLRHGHEFPFNFYIYPGGDWYLRLIPRVKTLGGFEIGTGVFINTQNPQETIAFIKEHFINPDTEKIQREHKANYERTV